MQTRRAHAFLLVAVLLMASCSGDGDSDEATATSSTAPSSTAPGSGGPGTEDPGSTDPAKAALAKAAITQSTDFPPGWGLQDPQEGLDVEILWQDITRCLGVERKAQPVGFATSPTYLRGLATQARATVEYPESSAQSIASALAGPKFKDCATEAFTADVKRNAPEGGVPGPTTLSTLDFPKLGQATSATRVNATISLSELQVPIFQDYIVVFDGDAVIRTVFLNPGSAFPPDLQRSLVEKAVARA